MASAVVIFAALGGDDIMAALRRASGAMIIALSLGVVLGAITHSFGRRTRAHRVAHPRLRERAVPIERDVRTDLTGLRPRLHDMARRPSRLP